MLTQISVSMASLGHNELTYRPRRNGRHFADNIFKYISLTENVFNLIQISLEWIPKIPINNTSLVQATTCTKQVPSHYLNQCWPAYFWQSTWMCQHRKLLLSGKENANYKGINGFLTSCGHFYKHGLTLILAWISNCIHYNVWDEITYPFLNFNGATVEEV